jgi:hypothetical protein
MLAAARRWSSMRQRRLEGIAMTAVGRDFTATLSTSMRGPLVTRKAETRETAFAVARRLLDDAERQQFNRGEIVSVAVAQSEG